MAGKPARQVVLRSAKREFTCVMSVASHTNLLEPEKVHPQPHVYITTHLACMRTAGWKDVDLDTVMTVSGAGLIFAYDPRSMSPKYAHLLLEPDERIAEATGFGWEWVIFEDEVEAWEIVRETLDSGRPAKAHFWEEILFIGYKESPRAGGRRVLVIGDPFPGPGVWWSWQEFRDWSDKCLEWRLGEVGRHTKRVRRVARKTVARQILREAIQWSKTPPAPVRRSFPEACFGLEGIRRYADDVEARPRASFEEKAWLGCHAINPQWTARGSTAAYLADLAGSGVFRKNIGNRIRAAAEGYELAHENWLEFYRQLGHVAPRNAWNSKKRRRVGADAVRRALEHETKAIEELNHALILGSGINF